MTAVSIVIATQARPMHVFITFQNAQDARQMREDDRGGIFEAKSMSGDRRGLSVR